MSEKRCDIVVGITYIKNNLYILVALDLPIAVIPQEELTCPAHEIKNKDIWLEVLYGSIDTITEFQIIPSCR